MHRAVLVEVVELAAYGVLPAQTVAPVARVEVVALARDRLPPREGGPVRAEVGARGVPPPGEPADVGAVAVVGVEVVHLPADGLLPLERLVEAGGGEPVQVAADGLQAGERGAVRAEVRPRAVPPPGEPAGVHRAVLVEVVELATYGVLPL